MASRQSDDPIALAVEERVGANYQRGSSLLNKQCEGRLEITPGRRVRDDESNIDTRGCRLHLFQLSRGNRIGRIIENSNGAGIRKSIRAISQFALLRD
jgi:hypothetical protein